MAEIIQFEDLAKNNEAIQPLVDIIKEIMEIPETTLNDDSLDMIEGMMRGAFTPVVKAAAIKGMIDGWEDEGTSRKDIINNIKAGKETMTQAIDELAPSAAKRKMINAVLESLYDIIDAALEKYHNYSIELPIKLDEGAHMPTYAHDGDAAADLYALETTIVSAHSISNKIKTGVHLQLPEGWIAKLAPRSSIGAKTPLRLSNELGIIDTGYTGDVTILFDNISDSDYTINAGDRIAQLWVEPIYRFKPVEINELQETERNSDGFGSTGK